MEPTCNRCDGPTELLGELGNCIYFRCRRCHFEMVAVVPEEDSEPDALDTDEADE